MWGPYFVVAFAAKHEMWAAAGELGKETGRRTDAKEAGRVAAPLPRRIADHRLTTETS